jgi:hypothetical protein
MQEEPNWNNTINNLTAKNNAGLGTYLDNCLDYGSGCTGNGNITLTGINTFYSNHDGGLVMFTHKNITLSGVTADKNGGTGVFGIADGSILVMGASLTNNGSYGWVLGGTTVTLRGVFAFGNNGGAGNTHLLAGLLIIYRTYP